REKRGFRKKIKEVEAQVQLKKKSLDPVSVHKTIRQREPSGSPPVFPINTFSIHVERQFAIPSFKTSHRNPLRHKRQCQRAPRMGRIDGESFTQWNLPFDRQTDRRHDQFESIEQYPEPLWRKHALEFQCRFFFQAEDGIRDWSVTGVQTCALPI